MCALCSSLCVFLTLLFFLCFALRLPQYDYFAQLLKAPKTDAQLLMDSRFPYPRFIECVEKGSQSRFLMAKLNPSITQSTMEYNQGSEPPGQSSRRPQAVCMPVPGTPRRAIRMRT